MERFTHATHELMHLGLQQSNGNLVTVALWICWPWVNAVSTNTWPGSKHKLQATASVKVWSLYVFYRGPSTSDRPPPVWKYDPFMSFTGVQAQVTGHRQCESMIPWCVLLGLGSKYKRQAITDARAGVKAVRILNAFCREHIVACKYSHLLSFS